MKTINEMLQQLNTMQAEHIKTLEQRINVINEHKQHLNETIEKQSKMIETLSKKLNKQSFRQINTLKNSIKGP